MKKHNIAYLRKMRARLRRFKEIELVIDETVIHTMEESVSVARRMRAEDVAGVVMVHNFQGGAFE